MTQLISRSVRSTRRSGRLDQLDAQVQRLLFIKRELTSSLDLTVNLSQALPLVLDAVSPPFSGATILLFDALK